jgi:hypothetical protein
MRMENGFLSTSSYWNLGGDPTSIVDGRLRTASQFDHLRHIVPDFWEKCTRFLRDGPKFSPLVEKFR